MAAAAGCTGWQIIGVNHQVLGVNNAVASVQRQEEEEKKSAAERAYQHVWQQSTSGRLVTAAATA